MNKYIHAGVCGAIGLIKMGWLTMSKGVKCTPVNLISPGTELTVDRGGKLTVRGTFRMRGGAKLRVRKGAKVVFGKDFSMSNRCMITAYDSIEIGDHVWLGPDVKIYDQDHDFSAAGGVKAGKYKTAPVKIGNDVWIGANVVILRGTEIGDGCVIGAGTVLKGKVPAGSMVYQKKDIEIRPIAR